MTLFDLYQVPMPEATETYAPVSHKFIMDTIQENLSDTKLEIVTKNFSANKYGTQLVGILGLKADSEEFNYQLMFRNSYDKSMAVGFAVGAQVMVCSNGMVITKWDNDYRRKHTGTVKEELHDRITASTNQLTGVLQQVEEQSAKMKEIEINPRLTAELCGRLVMEQGVINTMQLNIIRRELKNPSHQEFAEPTLWSLYNHTTEALKKSHPHEYMGRHRKLHEFVVKEFDL